MYIRIYVCKNNRNLKSDGNKNFLQKFEIIHFFANSNIKKRRCFYVTEKINE